MENETTQPIEIPFPEATDRHLRIAVGPCLLKLAPGEHDSWVMGTYRDPTGSIPCQVEVEDGKARISQRYTISRLPRLRGAPIFDLRLGTSAPYSLTIDGGANDIHCDFGGLPVTRLEARLGAGQVRFGFALPNPGPMERLHITAGAADVEVRNLANANAGEIAVEGGAAAFHLDFGGTLVRDTSVRISTGAAGIDVNIPTSTAAKIAAHTVLGGVDAGDGFTTKEGAYWTPAALAGQTPVLTVDANVTISGLKLRLT